MLSMTATRNVLAGEIAPDNKSGKIENRIVIAPVGAVSMRITWIQVSNFMGKVEEVTRFLFPTNELNEKPESRMVAVETGLEKAKADLIAAATGEQNTLLSAAVVEGEAVEFTYTANRCINEKAGEVVPLSSENTAFRVSEPIPVSPGELYAFTVSGGWSKYLYAFYDENDKVVGGFQQKTDMIRTYYDRISPVPATAATVRIAWVENNHFTGVIKKVTRISYPSAELVGTAAEQAAERDSRISGLENYLASKIVDENYEYAIGEAVKVTENNGMLLNPTTGAIVKEPTGNTNYRLSEPITVEPYTPYCISAAGKAGYGLYAFYDVNGNRVGGENNTGNIYTLDNNGRMILTILASVAEEESHSKSVIMNWSIERRFRKGLFLTPELLGYDRDEDGDLIVNEDEAETVKAIYYLYLNGVSFSDIAELLKAYKRKTKQGSYEWSASTLAEIVANERHCGDIRAWKTFTPNFLTHKAKKNNGERTQFRRKNHHEAIVSRTVYEAANFLRASRAYAKKARPLPVLSVVDNGILRGYVPLDKDWTGFSTDEYQKASESVMSELEDTRQIEYKAGLDMRGYEVVRSQYFSTTQNPAMTIADGKLSFNTACLKKFENVEYVELLLNSVNRCIAVRPCDGNNPNAIHWGKLREGRWCALSKSCRGLAKTLFDIMDWDQDLKYRFRGDFIENDDQKVMLFQLDEPEMVKTENIVLPPKEAETDDRAEIAGRTVKQIINILPPEWEDTFGRPITSIGEINLLEQRHYAADWDVLRPAKELAEYSTLTSEDLEELLHEAEKIIEGWPIPDEHGAGESADNGDGESAGVGTECGADVGAGTEENGDRADL